MTGGGRNRKASRERYPDAVAVRVGPPLGHHDALGSYAETFWLPVIGPSATVTARRLATLLRRAGAVWDDAAGGPCGSITVDLRHLGMEVGLPGGDGVGQPRGLHRALERLTTFGLARYEMGVLDLSLRWPTLSPRAAGRLPEPLRSQCRPPEREPASVTRSPLAS